MKLPLVAQPIDRVGSHVLRVVEHRLCASVHACLTASPAQG
jgi:hypothetical protein